MCRFSNSDVCLRIIRQVEYSEAEKRLSFNNAGLSELNFKQMLSALKYILKHEKLSKEVKGIGKIWRKCASQLIGGGSM